MNDTDTDKCTVEIPKALYDRLIENYRKVVSGTSDLINTMREMEEVATIIHPLDLNSEDVIDEDGCVDSVRDIPIIPQIDTPVRMPKARHNYIDDDPDAPCNATDYDQREAAAEYRADERRALAIEDANNG